MKYGRSSALKLFHRTSQTHPQPGSHAPFRLLLAVAIASYCMLCQSASARPIDRSSHGFGQQNCPPGLYPPSNCKDIRRMAYKLAIRKGYMDNNSNGKPDVMERPYKVNYNDCSTGNAHVACMFNDECTEEFGVLLGMRSNFKRHATTLFRGRNGQEFECDFTPGSSGISIRHVADTRIGPAFPDPDESMDPAYDCELNGASTSPLNPWGGSGGMGNLASMLSLLQMMRANQEQEELEQDALQGTPTPALPPLEELTPSPTPTATPTPQPTPRPALIDVSEDADTGAQKVGAITPDFDFAPLDFETPRNRRAAELPVPESAELPSNANSDPSLGRTKRSLDSWEDDRGDIFESRN